LRITARGLLKINAANFNVVRSTFVGFSGRR
jgi:hypothetical protein